MLFCLGGMRVYRRAMEGCFWVKELWGWLCGGRQRGRPPVWEDSASSPQPRPSPHGQGARRPGSVWWWRGQGEGGGEFDEADDQVRPCVIDQIFSNIPAEDVDEQTGMSVISLKRSQLRCLAGNGMAWLSVCSESSPTLTNQSLLDNYILNISSWGILFHLAPSMVN